MTIMKPPWNRAAKIIAWSLLLVGIILRLQRFCIFRSLWLDELFLADNILHRGFRDLLFVPLSQYQAAPPGFLILEKLSVLLFGSGERALRLPSMLAGLASLPMFLFLVQRTLNARAGLIAIAFFVFLGPLIYYSNELKPYELDAALAIAIMLTIFRWIESPTTDRWITAILIAIISVLCSFPAIFILAGVGCAAAFGLPRREIGRLTAIILSGVAAFGLEQWIFWPALHDPGSREYLLNYWSNHEGFMPIWPVWWIFRALLGIFRSPGAMWITYPAAALCALIIGTAWAFRNRGLLLKTLAPLPLILLASAIKQYPFADRLVLFYVPTFLIVISAGLDALCFSTLSPSPCTQGEGRGGGFTLIRQNPHPSPPPGYRERGPEKGSGRFLASWAGAAAGIALLAFTLGPSVRLSIAYFLIPAGREESLQTYRFVAVHYQPGDQLYLSYHAEMSFQYYGNRAGLKFEASQVTIAPRVANDPKPLFDDAKRFSGARRVWVVQVHTDEGPLDEKTLMLQAMDQIGRAQSNHLETGAGAWLYDCSTVQSQTEYLPNIDIQLQAHL